MCLTWFSNTISGILFYINTYIYVQRYTYKNMLYSTVIIVSQKQVKIWTTKQMLKDTY